MTFDKQIKRRDLLKTSAMLGIASAAGSVAPSLLKAEPAKPKEIIVRAWGGPWVAALKAGVSDPFTTKTGIKVRHDLTEDNEIQPFVSGHWIQHKRLLIETKVM